MKISEYINRPRSLDVRRWLALAVGDNVVDEDGDIQVLIAIRNGHSAAQDLECTTLGGSVIFTNVQPGEVIYGAFQSIDSASVDGTKLQVGI